MKEYKPVTEQELKEILLLEKRFTTHQSLYYLGIEKTDLETNNTYQIWKRKREPIQERLCFGDYEKIDTFIDLKDAYMNAQKKDFTETQFIEILKILNYNLEKNNG